MSCRQMTSGTEEIENLSAVLPRCRGTAGAAVLPLGRYRGRRVCGGKCRVHVFSEVSVPPPVPEGPLNREMSLFRCRAGILEIKKGLLWRWFFVVRRLADAVRLIYFQQPRRHY